MKTARLLGLLTASSLLITSLLTEVQSRKDLKNTQVVGPSSMNSPRAVFRPSTETNDSQSPNVSHTRVVPSDRYGKLPLSFEANRGQVDFPTKFLARNGGYEVYLSSTEAVFSLSRLSDTHPPSLHHAAAQSSPELVRMALQGANPNSQLEGCDELPGKTNYIIGNDPTKWHMGVPNYAKVKYANVYPGIDLIYYGNQRQLEYDFVLAPGADPSVIQLKFAGVQRTSINDRGDLILQTAHGTIRQLKPVVYQETNGTKQHVEGRYKLTSPHAVAFELAKYDSSRPLIIDPVFLYSTYFGGAGEDIPFGITVDSAGSAYVTGHAFAQGQRAFVSKLNATGTAFSYLTFFGGTGANVGKGIAVDKHGNSYVTGFTTASNFPTKNALQSNRRGWANAFVTKLDPVGVPVYSTYLGGSDPVSGHGEFGMGIALNEAGEAYVTGEATSIDFPTVNAFQPVKGGLRDCFVAKLNAAGTALVFSTYLGGSSTEGGNPLSDSNSTNPGNRIAVDSDGSAYVTGYTSSQNFPVVNALQSNMRGQVNDAFVTKLGSTGVPAYSTYLGGAGTGNDFVHGDYAYGIAVDSLHNVYVVGDTTSTDIATSNAFQRNKKGPRDGFVTKINAQGSAIVYSTYLGGSSSTDHAFGVAVDADANVYVIGATDSPDFPTLNLLQPTRGASREAFLCKLNSDGTALVFSSYVGGNGGDSGSAVALDELGNAFVAGWTLSTNFPTTNPIQPINGGQFDSFIAKVDPVVFSVIAIVSDTGGNAGEVSVTVFGGGFQPGASVKLRGTGHPEIDGRNPIVKNFSSLTTTFDLRGAATGLRDIVVVLPDGSSATLQNGFTVEEGGQIQPSIDIIGRNPIRAGRNSKFEALLNNRGNIDSGPMIAWLAVPESVSIEVDAPDLEDLGSHTLAPLPIDGFVYQWFLVDKLKAGQVTALSFSVKSNTMGQFELRGGFFEGNLVLNQTLLQQVIGQATQKEKQSFKTLAGPSFTDSDEVPHVGDVVFRLSAQEPRTGHVGVYDGAGFVIDLINDEFPFGHYQRIPLEQWKSEGTYVGSARQNVSAAQAQQIADAANALFDSRGADPVLFFAPPVLGHEDCVSTVADIFRSAGVTPLFDDWYPPGAMWELLTPEAWPETHGFWRLMNLENTRLVERGLLLQLIPKVINSIRVVAATDPNDKVGPLGVGTPQFISGETSLPYGIYFENLATATAAAQEVIVTDQLDLSKFKPESFALGPIIIGNKQLIPPPVSSEFIGSIDLRPANNLIVKVAARLDKGTGLITWKFSSLDPATGLPTDDPLAGFLPPNTNPPDGEGSVFFTVSPKAGLPTGTEVRNQASIVFDENAAIQTSTWLNTFDNSKPTSRVLPLPETQSSNSFNVQWSGTDVGAGIKDFTIFVSRDGQPYSVWLSNVSATEGTFTGQTGSRYSFYGIATDLTGNLEDSKTAAEASTLVADVADLSITNEVSSNSVVTGSNLTYTITITNHGPGIASLVSVTDISSPLTTVISCSATGDQNCAGSGNNRTVTFPSLAPNSSQTITIVAVLNCTTTDGNAIGNVATVSSSTSDPNVSNNSAPANISASNPPPIISCPANIARPTDPGKGSAIVTYPLPVVADNCPDVAVSCSHPSGNAFPVGTTTVTCTAVDTGGSQSACSFGVTVNDAEAPTITTCAMDKSLSTNGGAQVELPSLLGEVRAIDNFSPVSALKITQSPAAGTMIGPGITTITITIRDEANNAVTCQATVSVSQFELKDFVVFSSEFSWLLANVKVLSGSVGANTSLPNPGGLPDEKVEVQIGESVRMLQIGSNVVGDTIKLLANAQVRDIFYNELFKAQSSMFSARVTPLSLPILREPIMPSISPGTQDIEVQTGQVKTLASGRYRKITVRNRGTLILIGGTYQLSSLDVWQDAKILFRNATEVRIKTRWTLMPGLILVLTRPHRPSRRQKSSSMLKAAMIEVAGTTKMRI